MGKKVVKAAFSPVTELSKGLAKVTGIKKEFDDLTGKTKMKEEEAKARGLEQAAQAEDERRRKIAAGKKNRRELFQESLSQAGDMGNIQSRGRGLFGN